MVSARKNSESNIINHFFSYFCNRECSEYQLRRTVLSLGRPEEQTEKISAVLYNILKVINLKRGRRYINKIILAAYFSQEGLRRDLPDLVAKIEALPCLTLDEACLLLRKCFSLFIREVCLTSILTSKRISTSSKAAHLQKRRKITFQLHASAPIN